MRHPGGLYQPFCPEHREDLGRTWVGDLAAWDRAVLAANLHDAHAGHIEGVDDMGTPSLLDGLEA
jgi:hypothetical protein